MRFGGALLAGVVFAFGTFFVVWLAWPLTNIFPLLPWLLLLAELVVRRPAALPAAGLAALVGLAVLRRSPGDELPRPAGDRRLLRLPRCCRRGGPRAGALGPRAARGRLRRGDGGGDGDRRGHARPAVRAPRALAATTRAGSGRRRATPTRTSCRRCSSSTTGAGRPRPRWSGIVTNRGYYAGGLTLMLAVGRADPAAGARSGRPSRPSAPRPWSWCSGIDPIFAAVTKLPGVPDGPQRADGHLRPVRPGDARGLGARRAQPPRAASRAPANAGARGRGRDLRGAVRRHARRRHDRPGSAQARAEAWPGASQPTPQTFGANRDAAALLASGDPIPRTTVELIRLSALLQWLVLAGARAARSSRAPRRARAAAAPRAAGGGLRRPGRDGARRRPVPGEHGLQPGDPDRRTRTSPRPGRSATCSRARPNRFAGLNRPGIGQPLQPDLVDALRALRRARLRLPGRASATTASGGPPPRRPGDFMPPTGRAEPTAQSIRGLSLLSVTDVMQDPADPPVRLPGLRVAYTGPDARVYRNVGALPRAFLVDAPAGGRGAPTRRWPRQSTPAFDARHVAVTERRSRARAGTGAGPGRPGARRRLGAPGRTTATSASAVERHGEARSLVVLTDVALSGAGRRPSTASRRADRARGLPAARRAWCPRERHRVEFGYEPASCRVGWVLSLLGLVALAALLAGPAPARRRERGR